MPVTEHPDKANVLAAQHSVTEDVAAHVTDADRPHYLPAGPRESLGATDPGSSTIEGLDTMPSAPRPPSACADGDGDGDAADRNNSRRNQCGLAADDAPLGMDHASSVRKGNE
ncbi:hypothetical protein [Rhodococcus sp. ACT016]|uniref:hypothetical protein n=1 Tax=Rhodococcus sp. ACT016 TaxID=3134808 RepID=UPI003D265288